MKTKILAGIIMSLLLLLLLALPASASDYTLEIFGNANEDDTINMQDVTYTELIILEYRDETELADAKYDGKINMQDVTQIELVILGKEKELTLIDSADRRVTVNKPVERVVAFNHGMFVTMRSIKATDKVVGVCQNLVRHYGALFPDLDRYPKVGSFSSPDYEAVLNLHPEVVVLWGYDEEILEKFKQICPGITIICFDCDNPAYYMDEVRKSGYILDKREEACEFIGFYEQYMNIIAESVDELSDEDKPAVYFEMPHEPYQTVGAGTPVHAMIVFAGGDNIFSDFSGTIDMDPEMVMKRDPEIIVKGGRSPGYNLDDPTLLRDTREEIMNRPELGEAVAVTNGSVYIFPYGFVCTPTHFVCMAYLAKWFHPELFEDLDPEAIHQEYLTRFLEVDYDLNEHGVFVYPPLDAS